MTAMGFITGWGRRKGLFRSSDRITVRDTRGGWLG
jgi:hypothetical protein